MLRLMTRNTKYSYNINKSVQNIFFLKLYTRRPKVVSKRNGKQLFQSVTVSYYSIHCAHTVQHSVINLYSTLSLTCNFVKQVASLMSIATHVWSGATTSTNF